MRVLDWGTVDYNEATKQQLLMVDKVATSSDDVLIICNHPPVVTKGRATKAGDIFAWTGEVVESSRGGRATYHGPNQLVVYPILNLNKKRQFFPERDIYGYLRALEAALVQTLFDLGIKSEARTIKSEGTHGSSLTGVWVGEKKVASIGVAVKKWVTYHGLALNVTHDPLAYSGINPCGFEANIMTDLETEFKAKGYSVPASSQVSQNLVDHLLKLLA